MTLHHHILTGELSSIDDDTPGKLLTLQTREGAEGRVFVPCTTALHDALALPIYVGQRVIITTLLNADGKIIDTASILVNKPGTTL